MDSPLKILVCYHKDYTMPPLDDGIMLPIHVGKALSDKDLHIQGDNELNGQPCDNISAKNDCYCELTALYWAWKNLKRLYPDVKYVGLYHYRRFFSFGRKKFFGQITNKMSDEIKNYRVDGARVIRILEEGKIITGSEIIKPLPLNIDYCVAHVSDDYNIMCDVIKNDFPDYYNDFVSVMERGNSFFLANMFIMKYEDFEKYCEWIFAVLAKIEPLVPYQSYNTFQKRVFGFMSERLFKVWIRKNKKKTENFTVCVYRDKESEIRKKNILMRVAEFLMRCVNYTVGKITMWLIVFRFKAAGNLQGKYGNNQPSA